MKAESGTPAISFSNRLPMRSREISPGIHWLGQCIEMVLPDEVLHIHNSCNYLIQGGSASLLVDTGSPVFWPSLERRLGALLPNVGLDWIFPTHLEYPHAGSLVKLLTRYPAARVIADSSDYEMYFPNVIDRVTHAESGDELDLGGGYRFVFLTAVLKDLASTLWGYERSQQVMFVADGFSYAHHEVSEMLGEAVHGPGECALLSSELRRSLSPSDAAYINREAFWWTRYRDIAPFIEEIRDLVHRYPPKLVAPGHGGVIDDVENFIPILKGAHEMAYLGPSSR